MNRNIIWLVVLGFLAFLLFQGPAQDAAKKSEVIAPQAVTFDQVKTTIEKESATVDKVVFLKDLNGNVQQVKIVFKDATKAPLTAQLPGEAGSTRLLSAAEQAGVKTDAEKETLPPVTTSDRIWGLVGSILPMLLIFFVIFWLIGRMANAQNGAAKQIASSKAKRFEPEGGKKTFADVAGCDEAKQELMEVVNYLRNPGLLAYLGGRPPRGVLLVGGPGTGKTLLAKAVAGEANAAFFSISASQFVEMFVGVGAARVRDLFNQARENRPAIVFIDEIDAVGRQRGTGLGGGHDEREQTLNQLLVEMDGFTANDGIILMAATNRPDVLDPALIRPGRFDLQVLVDNPDKYGREQILKIHTKKKKLAAEVDLDIIATNTPGFSGAELEGLTDQAAIVAARRINDKVAELRKAGVAEKDINAQIAREITMSDMDEGIDRVQLGPAKEQSAKRMSRVDMENTSIHELGHAWVSQVLFERGMGGDPVTKITIVPRARALGYTQALPKGDRFNYTRENLKARIMMAMGGRAAQEIFLNTVDTGAQNDFEQATAWARRMVTDFGMSELGPISVGQGGSNPFLGKQVSQRAEPGPELTNLIDRAWVKIVNDCYAETVELLKKDADCIRKINAVLLEKETILGPEFKKLRDQSACAIACPDTTVATTGGSNPDLGSNLQVEAPEAIGTGLGADTAPKTDKVEGGDNTDGAPKA